MKDDIFNKISPSEALEILKQIAKTDKKLKKRIVELAEDLFRNVDVEAVCNDVFDALDGIDVQELWDRSGPKTNGYTSPGEMAGELFEEALEPFLQKLYRLFDLKIMTTFWKLAPSCPRVENLSRSGENGFLPPNGRDQRIE